MKVTVPLKISGVHLESLEGVTVYTSVGEEIHITSAGAPNQNKTIFSVTTGDKQYVFWIDGDEVKLAEK